MSSRIAVFSSGESATMTTQLRGRSWRSELQRMLDREIEATMQIMRNEESLQVRPEDHRDGLLFGPYGTSPVSGLHFENADDSATS
jgi:hypothetical protein